MGGGEEEEEEVVEGGGKTFRFTTKIMTDRARITRKLREEFQIDLNRCFSRLKEAN